jgi:hypothetical protein
MAFEYQSVEGSLFQCDLDSQQCQGQTKAHARCKKLTRKSIPLCWMHLKSQLGLQIKPATNRSWGDGLFALVDFAPGEEICTYDGELLSKEQIDERYGDEKGDYAPYALAIGRNWAIDGACHRGIGSTANAQKKKRDTNAKFVVSHITRSARIVATKHIFSGDEIFVSYGTNYFSKRRHKGTFRNFNYKRGKFTDE